jgi:hypothetical protein
MDGFGGGGVSEVGSVTFRSVVRIFQGREAAGDICLVRRGAVALPFS